MKGDFIMKSTAITTMIKMMESIPESAQSQVVEYLRDYLNDLKEKDEMKWDALFKKTEPQLVAAAQRARNELAEGRAKPMDFKKL